MANPTSNFNWQMPTPTDLVTDLPADIEVFGQAVDTSLADLKGGTTGQVLAKNSGTDMDFIWVAQDDSNAIQNAIVDAKGDLIAATANDTPARLAVGANDTMLVADSSAATGLAWKSATTQFPWTTYTPTLTNITLGNGTVTARYQQIGKTINVFFRLVWGSTTSCSTFPHFSLPVNNAYNSYNVGEAYLRDVSAGAYYYGRSFIESNVCYLMVSNVAGTYPFEASVQSTIPATWAVNDVWTTIATYEAA